MCLVLIVKYNYEFYPLPVEECGDIAAVHLIAVYDAGIGVIVCHKMTVHGEPCPVALAYKVVILIVGKGVVKA